MTEMRTCETREFACMRASASAFCDETFSSAPQRGHVSTSSVD
jgi:hypothetical protein